MKPKPTSASTSFKILVILLFPRIIDRVRCTPLSVTLLGPRIFTVKQQTDKFGYHIIGPDNHVLTLLFIRLGIMPSKHVASTA